MIRMWDCCCCCSCYMLTLSLAYCFSKSLLRLAIQFLSGDSDHLRGPVPVQDNTGKCKHPYAKWHLNLQSSFSSGPWSGCIRLYGRFVSMNHFEKLLELLCCSVKSVVSSKPSLALLCQHWCLILRQNKVYFDVQNNCYPSFNLKCV